MREDRRWSSSTYGRAVTQERFPVQAHATVRRRQARTIRNRRPFWRQRRFEQEARGIAALNHPTSRRSMTSACRMASRTWWRSWWRATRRGRSSSVASCPCGALALAAQIAGGSAAAYHAGIVHRNLKPENVMVTGSASGRESSPRGHPGLVHTRRSRQGARGKRPACRDSHRRSPLLC